MKRTNLKFFFVLFAFAFVSIQSMFASGGRSHASFNDGWKFLLGDAVTVMQPTFDDSQWRRLNLPHDWSIEAEFSDKNPATPGGGALPGGIGWYRKRFKIPTTEKGKLIYIEFDGVYRNSEVWINSKALGKRPYDYSSFRYELTSFLNYEDKPNVIAV
jgi:beta-galactosidase